MSMENEQTQTLTWANLVGNPSYRDDLDWDDCAPAWYSDWRRADRDGWGTASVWDGK